ncbi:uncharacterized protein LOC128335309 isoform X2 [Hemicordylus capensis]|uniref:uncharacterized protein LOC128335309 isoform X2 n=1 Tax=Hemicordylus capensis TaxID=884348 RepID=UPI00230318FF|nr:uncharacterized protein LOC128335309 isoform X2 [Hemicordylus capensis]
MGRAFVGALTLLLAAGNCFSGAGGELCRGWTGGAPNGAFQCPGLLDGADAKFCCGTCSFSYCCSSSEVRLDQTRCPRAEQLKAATGGPEPAPRPPSQGSPNEVILVFFLSIPAALLCICGVRTVCYCLRESRRGPGQRLSILNEDMEQTRLENLHFCQVHTRFPPPLPYSGGPPPYSVVSSHQTSTASPMLENPPVAGQPRHASTGHQEDEAMAKAPAAPEDAAVLGSTSEPALEMEKASQAHLLSSASLSSGAEAADGPITRPPDRLNIDTPRHVVLPPSYRADPPPYSLVDPLRAPAFPPALDNPQAELEGCGIPPRCSVMPFSYHGDPPAWNPVGACGPGALPSALDNPSVVQRNSRNAAIPDDEQDTLPPMALQDTTIPAMLGKRSAPGSVWEPALKMECISSQAHLLSSASGSSGTEAAHDLGTRPRTRAYNFESQRRTRLAPLYRDDVGSYSGASAFSLALSNLQVGLAGRGVPQRHTAAPPSYSGDSPPCNPGGVQGSGVLLTASDKPPVVQFRWANVAIPEEEAAVVLPVLQDRGAPGTILEPPLGTKDSP